MGRPPTVPLLQLLPALLCFSPCSTKRRLLLLDYDGTLIPHLNINAAPPESVVDVLGSLTADTANEVWIISGRSQQELGTWFEALVSIQLIDDCAYAPWT